jgi:hypothetical protein
MTNTELLKRILSATPSTRYVRPDDADNDEIEVTEKEWAARKTTARLLVHDGRGEYASDVVGCSAKHDAASIMLPSKVEKINITQMNGDLFFPAAIKQFKKITRFTVYLPSEYLNFRVVFTPTHLQIGCEKHTWTEWGAATVGQRLIESHFYYRVGTIAPAKEFLALLLTNKDRILARLTVKKKAVKKAVKKVAAKKAVKKTTKR